MHDPTLLSKLDSEDATPLHYLCEMHHLIALKWVLATECLQKVVLPLFDQRTRRLKKPIDYFEDATVKAYVRTQVYNLKKIHSKQADKENGMVKNFEVMSPVKHQQVSSPQASGNKKQTPKVISRQAFSKIAQNQ